MRADIHYSGRLEWTNKRGVTTTMLPGWAACCYGRRAELIRASGRQTHDARFVTCRACRRAMARAGIVQEIADAR